jgi:hypothetical protein
MPFPEFEKWWAESHGTPLHESIAEYVKDVARGAWVMGRADLIAQLEKGGILKGGDRD